MDREKYIETFLEEHEDIFDAVMEALTEAHKEGETPNEEDLMVEAFNKSEQIVDMFENNSDLLDTAIGIVMENMEDDDADEDDVIREAFELATMYLELQESTDVFVEEFIDKKIKEKKAKPVEVEKTKETKTTTDKVKVKEEEDTPVTESADTKFMKEFNSRLELAKKFFEDI